MIERNLQALENKTYTETNIRELLTSLREIGNEFISKPGSVQKFDQAIMDFLDVCNCIAHPNRDRKDSPILRNIIEFDERLDAALKKGGNELLSDVALQ